MTSVVVVTSAQDASSLLERAERRRVEVANRLEPGRRAHLGQFFTPPSVASFLASLFDLTDRHCRLLDPGAGVGSLSAAVADRWRVEGGGPLEITAIEVDAAVATELRSTMSEIEELGRGNRTVVIEADFVAYGSRALRPGLLHGALEPFDLVVMNPPYGKIGARSAERRHVRAIGVEVGNLYSAFLSLGMRLLRDDGQLVAITPRSFANGPYFRSLRQDLLRRGVFRRLHVYDTRDSAFADGDVLQENVVFRMDKARSRGVVRVSASRGPDSGDVRERTISHDELVHPDDPELFVHISADDADAVRAIRVAAQPASLTDLGLSVSTGRVVDFRAREHLRADPTATEK